MRNEYVARTQRRGRNAIPVYTGHILQLQHPSGQDLAMPVQFTLQCRCGHSAEMSFGDWEKAKDMVRRARCTVCGGKGRSLSMHRVEFLSEAETERQRREQVTGGR